MPWSVLVVDDDPELRATLRFLLEEEAGYAVAEAADGAEALEHLRAAADAWVVLLDLVMPNVPGMDVLRTIATDQGLLARTRVVIVSARQEPLAPKDDALVAELGVLRLRKPFSVDDVLAAVRNASDDLTP